MENEIIIFKEFIDNIKYNDDGNPVKVLFKFELLHRFGYDIVYNLYTKKYIAYNSAVPLPRHMKPVISGEVPYSVCQTFKVQNDEIDVGSRIFFRKKFKNKTQNILNGNPFYVIPSNIKAFR